MILGKRLLHMVSNRIVKDANFEIPLRYPVVLTPQSVESTLSNCPDDVTKLSFFLWCARQPNYFHERDAFDRMVPAVCRLTDRFESVKGLVKGLERFGCCRKPQTFLVLLRIYCCGGKHEFAWEAFMEMGNFGYTPNTFARNMIMDVLFKAGHVDRARAVFESTHKPNFLTFNIVLRNFCESNDLSRVKQVFKDMVRIGFRPNIGTFSMVLNYFCKAGRLIESLQIVGLMIKSGMPLSVPIWSILINGFCIVGQPDTAFQFFKTMIASGYSPNVVVFSSLIKGFMGCGMFDRAIGIWDSMVSEGCIPDLVLYNIMMDGLSKAGRYDDALAVFYDFSKSNLEPDSYTFSILRTICAIEGLIPWLVRRVMESGDLIACNSLLNYFCKSRYPSLAVDFFVEMVKEGFKPDKYSYAGVLIGLFRAGRTNEAIELYNGLVMSNFGLDAHLHTIMISGLMKVGKLHAPIRLFREARSQNFPLDVVSYTATIHGLLKSGRIREAHNLYFQMKEFSIAPNTYTCNVMLSGLYRSRQDKLIKECLNDMVTSGTQLDCITFNVRIGFLLKSDRNHAAFGLCNRMLDMGLKPNEIIHGFFVEQLAQSSGDVGDACHPFLKGYVEHGLSIDKTNTYYLPEMAA